MGMGYVISAFCGMRIENAFNGSPFVTTHDLFVQVLVHFAWSGKSECIYVRRECSYESEVFSGERTHNIGQFASWLQLTQILRAILWTTLSNKPSRKHAARDAQI